MCDTPHEAERCTEHDWERFPLQDLDGMDHWKGPCPWCEIDSLRAENAKLRERIQAAWEDGWRCGHSGLGDMSHEWFESKTFAAIDDAREG